MKLLLSLLLLTTIISCGKNAFVNKEDGRTSRNDGLQGEEGTCKLVSKSISPIIRDYVDGDKPFTFTKIRIGDHTGDLRNGRIKVPTVRYAQVVIDFDLNAIRNLETASKIEDISLDLAGSQFTKSSFLHKPQLCHNQNYTCSGDYDSMRGHIDAPNGYIWLNENFTNVIGNIDFSGVQCDHDRRDIDINYNMMELFKYSKRHTLKTSDLKGNYSVYVADDILVSDAKLNVSYKICSK